MHSRQIALAALLGAVLIPPDAAAQKPARLPYCVVDTGQRRVFGAAGQLRRAPGPNEPYYGQDAQRRIHPASYAVAADGLTALDRNTGLTWQRSPDTNGDGKLGAADKLTWAGARARPAALNAARFGGFTDWRLPTIKELYSLIDFSGVDPGIMQDDASTLTPFIDQKVFRFEYGHASEGDRTIDSQYASSTVYLAPGRPSGMLFGVNFADGRIKGYGLKMPGGREKTFYVQCVRGNTNYGRNDLHDAGDGTVTDRATGLVWAKRDSGTGMDWPAALAWVHARNRQRYLGHSDWRLPSAKELQSIVDYSRAPSVTGSAAISPLFECTKIKNEAGQPDYPWYWSSTAHGEGANGAAVYVCFGRSTGYMGLWLDVHGAGAQRSDPMTGNPADFPTGRGPQGDAIRILNYVRPVRSADPAAVARVAPDLTPGPVQRRPGGPGGMRPTPPGQIRASRDGVVVLRDGVLYSFSARGLQPTGKVRIPEK